MAMASSKAIMATTEATAITSFPATTYDKPMPYSQRQLLRHDHRQPYRLHTDRKIPRLKFGDLLVEVYGIGLNPADWKSAYVSPRNEALYATSLLRLLCSLTGLILEILDIFSHRRPA